MRYDDMWLWADDSPLRHPGARMLHDVFFQLDPAARFPLGHEYLPVRDLDVALDMAVWGGNEHGPHATQLALFALTVLALGALLVAFGFPRPVAWGGALLWAVHPIHVESVAWLSERKGVLAALLVLACGLAWVRYRRGRSRWWLVVAVLAAIAGVWSKAPAMFGPPAIAAWDLLLLPRARRRWIAIAAVGVATALAAVPVLAIARDARVVGASREVHGGRVASALGAQGHYVASMALARTPALAYPIQTDGPGPLDLALGAAAVIGSLALAWRARRRASDRDRRVLALLAWAWISFVPISQLLVRVHILAADRFAYLWSVAACVAAAWLLEGLRPVARTAGFAVLAGVLALATVRAEGAWTTSVALFERAYASNPADARMCEDLATSLAEVGRTREALAVLGQGLSRAPRQPYLLDEQARILVQVGHGAEALAAARAAADTGTSSAMWTYALMLDQAGRAADALPWARRAAANHPELVNYQRTLAKLLIELRRYPDAVTALDAALRVDPDAPRDHLARAQLLIQLGRRAEAARDLDAAARAPALAGQVAAARRALGLRAS